VVLVVLDVLAMLSPLSRFLAEGGGGGGAAAAKDEVKKAWVLDDGGDAGTGGGALCILEGRSGKMEKGVDDDERIEDDEDVVKSMC
jgi:hypothetical protein